ncbi:hypothetical protein ABH922_001820 [Rhodococcus sp. 27YEA15]|uniref:hypothetical protein n=1 Tax=Rhodococcus sp. 27YEA15 TaxID=3156259 RepID=UPI003C7ECC83
MTVVQSLLAGPRGRRLLLAYALAAEEQTAESHENSLHSAVFWASRQLDVERGTAGVLYGPGAEEATQPVVTPAQVAARVSAVALPDVTAAALRSVLAKAAGTAYYWQEPDGDDVLIAVDPVRAALRRIAEHVAGSPHTRWWTEPLESADQWTVGHTQPEVTEPTAVQQLQLWRTETLTEEVRAARERPTDPAANFSGYWWSIPPTRSSTRTLFDGTPAGLWFVEDGMDPESVVTTKTSVPGSAHVYEIDSAHAWAELCRRFPLEVTAQKRHDWYRTTGRAGRWVLPDWSQTAEHYDGVHLTVAGYLAAAGTAIDVDDETASVIAGWAPGETYWFTDAVGSAGDPVTWRPDNSRDETVWTREIEP